MCVFGIKHMAANATEPGKGAAAYKFYTIAHIAIFGRMRGAPRLSNATVRSRAARAATPGGLQAMWEERLSQCGVRGRKDGTAQPLPSAPQAAEQLEEDDDEVPDLEDGMASDEEGDGPEVPDREPLTSDEEKLESLMLRAQHYINAGDLRKAFRIFGAAPMADARLRATQLALLDLTPYEPLPSAECMADKPGTAPFTLKAATCDKVIPHLPRGRAVGTCLTSYELISATYEAGAREGWILFFTVFCRGALADDLADLQCALRAVMLCKDDTCTNLRPLGIGEAERRCGYLVPQ